MPFDVQKIPPSTVIVAWEIEDEARHEAFRKYLDEDLDAAEMCENVYCYNGKNVPIGWKVIFEEMERLIDPEHDIVYIWDMAVPRGELKRQLFLSKLG